MTCSRSLAKVVPFEPAVRKGGLEPPRDFSHQILSLARLPIPPLSLGQKNRVCRAPAPTGRNERRSRAWTRQLTPVIFVRSFPSSSLLVLLLLSACAPPRQVVEVAERPAPVPLDTATAPEIPSETPALPNPYAGVAFGRFDTGKMWTFDAPPMDYLREEYGFEPDSAWFEHARGAALRFSSYCSASFVSAAGLVMTNHHCGRESVSKVSRPGENLLDKGFYAPTLAEERKVEGLHVDRLVSIRDVTRDIYGDAGPEEGGIQAAEVRADRAERLAERLTKEAAARDSAIVVEVIPLYDGGRYAAYTFRRFKDVRLVAAPELQLGFFGGDWDNFTYPRYSLDFAFFRVYDADGAPLRPGHWFAFDSTGADVGEPVFVVGNPGSTSRLAARVQLEYERDVELPHTVEVLGRRSTALAAYIEAHPEEAERYDLRNSWFSIANTLKSQRGQLSGLRSDWLIPRKGAAEEALKAAIAGNDSLRGLYEGVFADLEALDRSKRASSRTASGFSFFAAPDLDSHVLTRAMYAYVYTVLKQRGAPPEQLADIRKEAVAIKDRPRAIEREFVRMRLEEIRDALGDKDPTVRRLFGTRSPADVAAAMVDSTALADSSRFVALLDGSYLSSGDSTVDVILAIAPLYFTQSQQLQSLGRQEDHLNARLARARLALFGTTIPPDASFSLRLADGVVKPYRYNGTEAPAFTTFYGLYDRHASLGSHRDWRLPDRWLQPPAGFDRSTPMNLVSTNDITGGNSGSPLLDRELRVVGLVFDSNMEALPNEYVYTDDAARTVSVDVRGILESLDVVYDADRLIAELIHRKVFATEAEADAAMAR